MRIAKSYIFKPSQVFHHIRNEDRSILDGEAIVTNDRNVIVQKNAVGVRLQFTVPPISHHSYRNQFRFREVNRSNRSIASRPKTSKVQRLIRKNKQKFGCTFQSRGLTTFSLRGRGATNSKYMYVTSRCEEIFDNALLRVRCIWTEFQLDSIEKKNPQVP